MIYRQSWTVDLGEVVYANHNNSSRFIYKIKANDGDQITSIIENINIELEKYTIETTKENLTKNGSSPEKIYQEIQILKNSPNIPKLILKNHLLKFQTSDGKFFVFNGPFKELLDLNESWYDHKDKVNIHKTRLHYIEALYVYCDIIELQFTGDTMSQLLRTVVVSNKYNSLVSVNYEIPHYVPVNQNHINTINIDIRSDTGNHIHFFDGKVIVKLHFRPMRNGF
jgi:hypothetical protein